MERVSEGFNITFEFNKTKLWRIQLLGFGLTGVCTFQIGFPSCLGAQAEKDPSV